MALNSSGPISIGGSTVGQSINLAIGRTATQTSNLNETLLRSTANKATGAISFSDFYGKPAYGTSWKYINYTGGNPFNYVYGMACSSNGQTIVVTNAVSSTKLYRSTDYGESFSQISSCPLASDWRAVAISANGSVIAGAAYNDYIYVSTNSGSSFTQRASLQKWMKLAMSSDGTRMVASTGDAKIYTSSDSGTTWTLQATPTGLTGSRFVQISGSSTLQYLMAAQFYGDIYISSDYGVTWTPKTLLNQYSNPIQSDGCACSSTGAIMYASAYDGAILKSTNYGSTFTLMATPPWQMSRAGCDGSGNKVVVGNSNGFGYINVTDNAYATNTDVTLTPMSGGMNGAVVVSSDGTAAYVMGVYGQFHKLV